MQLEIPKTTVRRLVANRISKFTPGYIRPRSRPGTYRGGLNPYFLTDTWVRLVHEDEAKWERKRRLDRKSVDSMSPVAKWKHKVIHILKWKGILLPQRAPLEKFPTHPIEKKLAKLAIQILRLRLLADETENPVKRDAYRSAVRQLRAVEHKIRAEALDDPHLRKLIREGKLRFGWSGPLRNYKADKRRRMERMGRHIAVIANVLDQV